VVFTHAHDKFPGFCVEVGPEPWPYLRISLTLWRASLHREWPTKEA
jgi:hypothetical protein